MKKLHHFLFVAFLINNATDLSASHESEIRKTTERVWNICTKKLPGIAWTVTKGIAALYSAYLAVKIIPELADNVKELPAKKAFEKVFEHGCGLTAFGLLALKAADSFLKDVEKL